MKLIKCLAISASVLSFSLAAVAAHGQSLKDGYNDYEGGPLLIAPNDTSDLMPAGGFAVTTGPSGGNPVLGFQGISQYDTAGVSRNFIPPDTMGAVGKTQYMEIVNGGVAVFDKATGARTSFTSDTAFWAGAGQTGTNGDPRIMYNASANRWIALAFGASVADIQIAVSDTSNALGVWKSVKFTGYAGGTADYPTLALDKNAVYIGTNDFNGSNNYVGTTLNVIPIASLFNATTPTVSGLQQFVEPFAGQSSAGFAIQGVNNGGSGTTGKILTVSAIANALTMYDLNNAGSGTATISNIVTNIGSNYDGNGAARQPYTTGTGNPRVIDTLDDRVGSSVYEANGKIYTLHTITQLGSAYTSVRYSVINAATGALLDEGNIGDGSHDYYQGSLAVNSAGQVVIAFDRSGTGADGKISFLARTYNTGGTGQLYQTGSELLLQTSLTDSYHNGSIDGQAAAGRQRWGDYSAVSLDPTNDQNFWVIGEYAREFNDAANGHPSGTGGSRWSTWIQEISVGTVPEPGTWLMMIAGFGLVGASMRRRSTNVAVQFN
jgi:hypothetical protein